MRGFVGFLRSMKLGLILMLLIVVCSLVGSLILQGEEATYYAKAYGEAVGRVINVLHVDNIFASWYFIALIALLCVNLTLCSITRMHYARRLEKRPVEMYVNAPTSGTISDGRRESLCKYLRGSRFKEECLNNTLVFSKHRIGYYGSFITHLSILLILVFGAATLYFVNVADVDLVPGEVFILPDGVSITLNGFNINNESGRLGYKSTITVTDGNGETGNAQITVNDPYTFGNHKFYQQTYGIYGSIEVTSVQTGKTDTVTLKEPSMVSLDGHEGLQYLAVYPSFLDEISGYKVDDPVDSRLAGPVYECAIVKSEETTPVIAFPGDIAEAGGIRFAFKEPINYSGIRVKTAPLILLYLLFASFAVIIVGLWLCFFYPPVQIAVRESDYAVSSPKDVRGLEIRLKMIAENHVSE